MDDRRASGADFVLGSKAEDLWLYTCELCANEKLIPKKYRYTTGSSILKDTDDICELIEGANLLDLRIPKEAADRLELQRAALRKLEKLGKRVTKLLESKQYPGIGTDKARAWGKNVLTVRYMCAAWYEKDKARVNRLRMQGGGQ